MSHLTLSQRAAANFDHPDSLDTELLVHHIKDLKSGKAVKVPIYDFSTHTRTEKYDSLEPKRIILVEGILIFSDQKLVQEFDVKVFVEAESDVRLMRRIERDVKERGRTLSEVIEQYAATVRPMHDKFVEPSKKEADIIIRSNGSNATAVKIISSYLKLETGVI